MGALLSGALPPELAAALLRAAALAALGGGLGWALWALLARWRAGNPLLPLPGRGAAQVMVDDGPYRFSRHPLLAGLVVASAGGALLAQSAPALAAVLLARLALARWWLPRLEARLAQRFGGWWRDYAQAVPRRF